MASKKYLSFTGILCLFAFGSFAQVGTNYNVLDSSLISKRNLPQHNEFVNNAYPFPAKPRNQWEVGVKGGVFTVIGDVPHVFPTAGFGVHVRKALGYVFSLRAEYLYGIAKGLNWKPRNQGFSDPFILAGYTAGPIFDNYKTKVQDLSLQGVITFNNVRFHKAKAGFVLYGFFGFGGTIYETKVNALNGSTRYNFSGISGGVFTNRKDTKKAIKDLLDDSYESKGENPGAQGAKVFGQNFKPSVNVGGGVAIRLGKRVNLAIEDRLTIPKTDLLDGQRWQNITTTAGVGGRILSPDYDNYNYLTVGLNFNLGSKAVEPLWWMNPLDYAYSEINAPKHMKMPKPILDDADADGITDQFDLEPNTPAGAPVDSHGVSRDTDGDGVPDYKDKELITPTQCQPVDADGVGKCPPPSCCTTLDSLLKEMTLKQQGCGVGDLPSISFSGRGVSLSNDAKAVLATVAERLKNNPNCKIAVTGYGESSKAAQQLSWDRVNAVINHLVEKEGISADRLIFKFGETGGDANTIDLRDGSNEEGPNTVPAAPHPNLRRRK